MSKLRHILTDEELAIAKRCGENDDNNAVSIACDKCPFKDKRIDYPDCMIDMINSLVYTVDVWEREATDALAAASRWARELNEKERES